jgi:hypothetical protein
MPKKFRESEFFYSSQKFHLETESFFKLKNTENQTEDQTAKTTEKSINQDFQSLASKESHKTYSFFSCQESS